MIITIDGLSTNGKSTLANKIAKDYDLMYLNTGYIYRCIALKIMEKGKENINSILEDINIQFKDGKVLLDGKDVTMKIKTEEVSFYSTTWATIPMVKDSVRKYQKNFIKTNKKVVIEGRDIATRIAPNADLKFYLYSSIPKRAERLCAKLRRIYGENVSIDAAIKHLKRIDEIDINDGNFVKPNKSIEIDTTNLNLGEVYEIMVMEINNFIKENGNEEN